MEQLSQQMSELWAYAPRILGALAILIVGYIVARLLWRATRSLSSKAGLDERVATWTRSEPEQRPDREAETAEEIHVEYWIATVVYYAALVLVAILVVQTLAVTQLTEPINVFLTRIADYLPNIIGPAVLLLVAWGLATLVRALVYRGLTAADVDDRFHHQFGAEDSEPPAGPEGRADERAAADEPTDGRGISLADSVADIAYWFVFLLFLPAILDGLRLGGLLAPVQGMVDELLAFIPNLVAAAIIFAVGYFIARFLQQIAASFLKSIGTDRLADRLDMQEAMGERSLSDLIGYVVFALILIPVAVASLNALQIAAVTEPASDMLDGFLAAVPDIFAAALVVAIAYAAGRLLGSVTETILEGVGFDHLPDRLGVAEAAPETETEGEGRSPSNIAGLTVFAGVLLIGTMEGFETLGFETLAGLIGQFVVFAANVLLGLAIFAIGLYFAQLASRAIRQSRLDNREAVATIAQASIIVLTAAMALREMGIANEIINLAFGLGFGAIALAAALAFGLGGREPAGDLFRELVERFRSSGPTPASGPPEGPSSAGGSSGDGEADDESEPPHSPGPGGPQRPGAE